MGEVKTQLRFECRKCGAILVPSAEAVSPGGSIMIFPCNDCREIFISAHRGLIRDRAESMVDQQKFREEHLVPKTDMDKHVVSICRDWDEEEKAEQEQFEAGAEAEAEMQAEAEERAIAEEGKRKW